MMNKTIRFIRELFSSDANTVIPLHRPYFLGSEKKFLNECIDSTFVSSVGEFVEEAEKQLMQYTLSPQAVACVNGTAALHVCLKIAGVKDSDLVLTQALTFVATCNAINYTGASPAFLDVDRETLGLCPKSLQAFLDEECELQDSQSIHKRTKKRIAACVPMHTFGFPCQIDKIVEICIKHHIPVIEDAAESLGSFYKNKHTGTFADFSSLSFNGNKIVTSGGGGALLLKKKVNAQEAKHLTTQAKVAHRWEFNHDKIGYNYRMPNINAALLCAQLNQLEGYLKSKRELAEIYENFFRDEEAHFFTEPKGAKANYWLNTLILDSKDTRDRFLKTSNEAGVHTRPAWTLMNKLPMYRECVSAALPNSIWLQDRLINLPSSVRPEEAKK